MKCLNFIAEEVCKDPALTAVIGIQLPNLGRPNDGNVVGKYAELLEILSKVNPQVPIYIDDDRDLEKALEWSQNQNVLHGQRGNPIIISTNKMYAIDNAFEETSVRELIEFIPHDLPQKCHDNKGSVTDIKAATAVYVADYSCTLPARAKEATAQKRTEDLTIQFGRYQTRRWHEIASGSAFWTWNAALLNDTGADFKTQVQSGSIYCPSYLFFAESQVLQKLVEADQKRSQLMTSAIEKHVAYFEKVGGQYEHWRYADGWHLGFTDARAFFASRIESIGPAVHGSKDETIQNQRLGSDKIGALDLWILKRIREEDLVSRDRCEYIWEWEHGFRAGVRSFQKLVGIQT